MTDCVDDAEEQITQSSQLAKKNGTAPGPRDLAVEGPSSLSRFCSVQPGGV